METTNVVKVLKKTETHKKCPVCKEVKLFSHYHGDKLRRHGVYPRCKQCRTAKNKEKYWEDPKRSKNKNLLRRYGITLQQYEEMHSRQQGRCALCNRHETEVGKRRLAVDHCHRTNKIRALLCGECNMGLGKFHDSQETLKKAINYLKENLYES